jgi:orotate phosphoribosyltransferase
MTKTDLAKAIYRVSHLTGKFLLRSGIESNEYFDKYRFESDPIMLKTIGYYMSQMIERDFDLLAGLEMGGIPISTALSYETSIPQVLVRKKAKEYGTNKLAEGPEIKGKKLLIVEDVVTSGGQIILSAKDLRDLGAIVDTAVCVIDRESGGAEKLAEAGIKLIPLFKMSDLKAVAK